MRQLITPDAKELLIDDAGPPRHDLCRPARCGAEEQLRDLTLLAARRYCRLPGLGRSASPPVQPASRADEKSIQMVFTRVIGRSRLPSRRLVRFQMPMRLTLLAERWR